MPWFKVDDKLHDHRKSRRAKKAAMGVWVLAGSWCMDNLTDGFVPESVLNRWGSRRDATQLVEANLWDPATKEGEKGWQFRNWSEFQPSREEVEAEREATKERVRKWRESKRRNAASNAVTPAVTNADVTAEVRAPRPDPTRPDPSNTYGEQAPAASGDEVSAQRLIGEWIEKCSSRPPGRVVGQTSREVKALLDEGIPVDDIRVGMAAWHRKGLHPSTLASVVHEARQNPSTSGRTPFPHDGTQAEKDAWAKAQPPPTDGAYYGGSAR